MRHAGQKLLFDWSASKNKGKTPAIHWAAFYSDCEHEVFEVTSGHRITLTYNLFVTRGLGHLAGSSKILNTRQLPLYATLRNALAVPRFLRGGKSPYGKIMYRRRSLTLKQDASWPSG